MLRIAAASIKYGLQHFQAPDVNLNQYSEKLTDNYATFITLEINGHLRGCIGSLLAHRPLAEDISSNAYAAAFQDPRFSPLEQSEYENLDIHVSILSTPEKMEFDSEQSLLNQIQPGIDGLILTDDGHRATFLPSVWESLTSKELFLSELKQKAGLNKNHWSNTIQFEKYTTFSFGGKLREISKT